jgi:Tfp pilus assembly protein PilE
MKRAGLKISISCSGTTLVELLIALALMSLITLSFSNFLIKSNVTAASLNMRFTEGSEVQMLLMDIQKDFEQGVFISNNSYDQRLEYTTYGSTGAATKKIYRITTISGKQYMQLSLDGGSTWDTPYRVSSYDKYSLSGTPKFLYAWGINNCTDFVDSSGNGVWLSGSDTAGTYLACTEGTSSPALSNPSQATKVDFQNFQFSTGTGSPEAIRTLPADLYLTLRPPLVRSNAAAVAPAVKESPLVRSFSTNTANSLFGTAFDVQSAVWDASRQRLVIVGGHSSGSNTIYLADRLGVLLRSGLTTSAGTIQAYSTTVKTDSNSVLVLGSTDSGSTYNVYGFAVSGSVPLNTASTLSLTGLANSPTGIAYDASTSNDFYVVGANTATSALQITERNTSTGALVGSAWALPAAFDGSHPPGGLAIDPVTGNFLVVRNYVNGSSPNKTIDIYIITRATGSSSYFSVNIDDLGSTATGTTGKWGLGYDPMMNRIFLSDNSTDKIYEVIPSQLISPTS